MRKAPIFQKTQLFCLTWAALGIGYSMKQGCFCGKWMIFGMLGLLMLTGCQQGTESVSLEERRTGLELPAYLVVVDCGHGGFDAGASGDDTGVREDGLNLKVGLLVQEELEAAGVLVVMTRQDEKALGETKKEDMTRRGEILCTEGVDAVVSIHMNHFSDRKVQGPMTFYQAGADAGEELAQTVMDALCTELNIKSRLANPGNNFVTRVPTAPAVLVECGFLSNREEEQLLQQTSYQQKLAHAIATGILTYLQNILAEVGEEMG